MARTAKFTRLFVYGTLLRGESNHAVLAGCPCLGTARTEPSFELVTLGPYPALLAGGSGVVIGELYAVSPRALKRLDRFEDHPRLYYRAPIQLAGGQDADAYLIRAADAEGKTRIPSGDWRTFKRRRRHARHPPR